MVICADNQGYMFSFLVLLTFFIILVKIQRSYYVSLNLHDQFTLKMKIKFIMFILPFQALIYIFHVGIISYCFSQLVIANFFLDFVIDVRIIIRNKTM